MKRLTSLLVALMLVALVLPAEAAWEIRQRDTGEALLTDQNSIDVPLSGGVITVQLTSLGTPGTTFVVAHRPGRIRKAYVVAGGNTPFVTGSTTTVFLLRATTGPNNAPSQFRPVSSGATFRTVTTSHGAVGSGTFNDVTNDVQQGSVIAIVSDGSGSNPGKNGNIDATVVIVVE